MFDLFTRCLNWYTETTLAKRERAILRRSYYVSGFLLLGSFIFTTIVGFDLDLLGRTRRPMLNLARAEYAIDNCSKQINHC